MSLVPPNYIKFGRVGIKGKKLIHFKNDKQWDCGWKKGKKERYLCPRMSDWSQTPPKAMRWNSLPRVLAMERPTLVLPTPGGPTKQRIGPCKHSRTQKISQKCIFNITCLFLHKLHPYKMLQKVYWTIKCARPTLREVFSCRTARYSNTRLFSFSIA